MKEYKQFGAYGLVIKNNQILFIKKFGVPYNGKLDLPEASLNFVKDQKLH